MVVPPCYAKRLHVKNTTLHPVILKATFGTEEQNTHGNKFIIHSQTIAPGEHVTIPEQEYDMGTWKALAPVHKVEVNGHGDNGPIGTTFIPSPDGIIDLLTIQVENHPTNTNALHVNVI